MPYPFQPVILSYGNKSGDTGQNIPTLDRHTGGEGLHVNFTTDHKDPFYHHANGGGISVVNGSANPNGSWASGTLNFWVCDLWAPSPTARTEIQVWLSRVKINSDGSSAVGDVSDTLLRRMAQEYYAPLQHDDLLWDANGNVVKDVPGHSPSVKHFAFNFDVEVPSNQRLRFNIAQWHGSQNVPDPYNKPYPGYIKYAVLHMKVYPA